MLTRSLQISYETTLPKLGQPLFDPGVPVFGLTKNKLCTNKTLDK